MYGQLYFGHTGGQHTSIMSLIVVPPNRQKLSIANPGTAYKLQDASYFFRSDLIFSLLPGLSLSQKKERRHKKKTPP
jgi:hypothetical protein